MRNDWLDNKIIDDWTVLLLENLNFQSFRNQPPAQLVEREARNCLSRNPINRGPTTPTAL